MMTREQIAELDALAQELYKRTTEWWVASLAADKRTVRVKRAATEKLINTIYTRLVALVGVAEAGWFKRSKAAEPARSLVASCADGNWINEAWHRKDRLEGILVREERALVAYEIAVHGPGAQPPRIDLTDKNVTRIPKATRRKR